MADDIQDQAKRIIKDMDAAAKLGKTYTITADQSKILIKAQNELKGSLQNVSSQSKKTDDSVKQLTDSFSKFQTNLVSVKEAFDAPKTALREFADRGMESGADLMKMYAALGGLVFSKPIENATKAIEGFENQLKELQDLENKSNPIKGLEEQLKKEQELCKKEHDCDKDKIKSLQDQVRKEKLIDDVVGKLTKEEQDRLKQLRAQKPELEKNLTAARNHKDVITNLAKEYQRIVALLGDAFDRFVQLDKAAAEFRMETGLNKAQMKDVETMARQVNQELAGFGVSIEESYNAAKALKDQFGAIENVSKGQIETVALLNKNLGVTNESAAGFLQKMESVGGLTEQQAKGMAGLAAGAATAAGVPLDKVMQDVAGASDETLAMMRGNVRQMTAASIQAQRLGVNLGASAKSAKGLLNFSESVNDEMEASVLLGKNLNLNYARQLSFQGDAAGAQAEILKQVKSMGDFQKMNVFQQEALAKASGYSVGELGKMLKNQEKLDKLTDKQKQAYEDATKALKEQNEETGEQMLYQAQMQSTMQQLKNTFAAFKQSAADALTPLVMVATKILVPVLKVALVAFNAILLPVKLFANLLYKLWDDWKLGELMDFFSKHLDYAVKVIEKVSQWTNDTTESTSGWVTAIKGVGAAIGAVMVTMYLFPKMFSTVKDMFSGVKSAMGMFKGGGAVQAQVQGLTNTVTASAKSIGTSIASTGKGIADFISNLGKGIGVAIAAIGRGFGLALKGIGTGLQTFANPKVILGTAIVVAAIIGLAIAARIAAPVFKILADMIVALAPFVVQMVVPAINAFKEVLIEVATVIGGVWTTAINAVKDVLIKLMDVIGNVVIKGMEIMKELFLSVPGVVSSVSTSLRGIALAAPGLFVAAGAVTALTVALVAMGIAMGGGVVGAVGGLFKGNTLSKLNDLASALYLLAGPAEGLRIVSESVGSLFANFTQLGGVVKAVGGLLKDDTTSRLNDLAAALYLLAGPLYLLAGPAEGLRIVSESVGSLFANFTQLDTFNVQLSTLAQVLQTIANITFENLKDLDTLATLSPLVPMNVVGDVTGGKAQMYNEQSNNQIVDKLDQLITLMSNGGIAVNLDGRKVSEQLAIASS